MNLQTRWLMASSALVLLVCGLSVSFFTPELLEIFVGEIDAVALVFGQLLGAAWLGFAFMNWMGRGTSMGGIYGRPVSMPNFVHFMIVGITLTKLAFVVAHPVVIAGALASAVFAGWFALVVFAGQPTPKT